MKRILLVLALLSASAFAQTTCINCPGSAYGATGGATVNVIPKATGSNGQLADSLHTDTGTTDTYTGTGGLVAPAHSSNTANVASAGQFRLASADTISWRNNANGADVSLAKTGATASSVPADSLDASGFGSIKLAGTNNALVGSSSNAYFVTNGTPRAAFNTNGITMISSGGFTVSSGSDPTIGADVFLTRSTTATWQLGAANLNGTPVNQTLRSQGAITGTDLPGGRLDIFGGPGTGAGATSQISLSRALMLGTGTTTQSTANAITVCESKTLSNTTATTTTFATIGLASNSGGGASITITLVASDGTNFDAETQSINLSYVNKATVMTVSTPTITASSAANNSGSATIGFTATGASPTISLKVTPAFTTIVPTTVTMYTEINNHGAGAVSCQ